MNKEAEATEREVRPSVTSSEKTLGSDQEECTRSDKDSTSQHNAETYVTGSKLVITVATVSLVLFLILIDTMVISTAIPRITDDFNSLADVGWYASAYQVGIAAPQPLAGKIYLLFSTKKSFLCFLTIFELGSALCGAALSSTMLIIGRAVAGLGAAGLINGAIMIISGCVPLEKRPGLIGATVGAGQLGLAIGPLIGGAFTSFVTWRWSFYINLPVGAVAAAVILFVRIPEQVPKARALSVLLRLHRCLDLLGFFLFALAVVQLLLALQYGGNDYAWGSSQVIGLFCGTGVTSILWFFWNQRKGDDALLPHSMIRRRTVWSGVLYQAFFMSALYGAVYFLPIYFQAIHNASPMLSGVYLLPTILPELVMAAVAGGLVMKIGSVLPIGVVSIVLLSIANGFYSLLKPNSPAGWWIGFQVMAGIGSGLGLNLAINAVQAAVTGEELSSAMSFVVFAQALGPGIALVLCNVIFDDSLRSQISQFAPNVNAAGIIKAGATGFRTIVSKDDLPNILIAYTNSVDRVFYLVAAMSAVCGLLLWAMGWQDLRPKKQSEDNRVDEESQK